MNNEELKEYQHNWYLRHRKAILRLREMQRRAAGMKLQQKRKMTPRKMNKLCCHTYYHKNRPYVLGQQKEKRDKLKG